MSQTRAPQSQPNRRSKRSGLRWPIAILVFFVLLAIADAIFIYLAVSNPDPVVESYSDVEER